MAIFNCEDCTHIQETSNNHIGKRAKCPKCHKEAIVHNTLAYIKTLREKLDVLEKELKSTQKIKKSTNTLEIYDSIPLLDFDIHDTNHFSKQEQYYPIIRWFEKKGIKAKINPNMMDTTGFFDEIAIQIGDNFNIFGSIVNQIKYIQNKKYDTVKISLAKKDTQEIKKIIKFCKTLYEYSFISRFNENKKDKSLYLTLHDVTRIKSFFNGLWMEWFVLIKLLELFKKNNITPAIARSVNISFSNNSSNELDIFFINQRNEPICIECKTGEFRQDLSKYLSLQKKLNIKKENFILCVFGLSKEQTQGLTSMYEFTLANESTLIHQVKNLI